MRKDIEIPEVTSVYVVAVKEWDKEFLSQQWNVYLINDTDQTLSTVLVMSRGNDSKRKTSTLRHGLGEVAAKSHAKIEILPEEVLGFKNEYLLTYFNEQGLLHDKTFVFAPYSVKEEKVRQAPVMDAMVVFSN